MPGAGGAQGNGPRSRNVPGGGPRAGARQALNLLGRKAPPPADRWPDELRATLVRVLATGPSAIAALEALDQRHLLERYLPEWRAVRNKPQRNPYHRFTVDRHLL